MKFNPIGRIFLGLAATTLALAGCSHSGSGAGGGSGSGAAVAVNSSGGESSSSQPGAVQIAFVTNNASDYWSIAKAGVDAAARELGPGVNVQFVIPGDGTAATQKQDVDDLIAKGVKAIAISPVDPTNQTPWLDIVAAKAAVLTQDSDAPDSKRLAYLGTDNHAAGVLAGQQIKAALPQGGKIMLFVGTKDAQNAHDRIQGIEDALKGTSVQVLDVRTDNTDHALAKTNAVDAMTANPDLAMEVGIWSYNGAAIASAVQDAHKVGKVKIICFDQEKGTLAGVKSGAITSTIVQQPYQFGYQGAKMMAKLAAGDKSALPPGGVKYFPAQVVNAQNIDGYIAELDKETGKSWGPGQ